MITKLGKEKLEQQLDELQKELARTFEERRKAAEEGDLKENSAYIFYGERAQVLDTQISQLRDDLKMAKVKMAPTQTEIIEFGHAVTVCFEDDQRQMTITLVGKNDASLKIGWVSLESPLGLALTGKKKGEKVMVNDQMVQILEVKVGEV